MEINSPGRETAQESSRIAEDFKAWNREVKEDNWGKRWIGHDLGAERLFLKANRNLLPESLAQLVRGFISTEYVRLVIGGSGDLSVRIYPDTPVQDSFTGVDPYWEEMRCLKFYFKSPGLMGFKLRITQIVGRAPSLRGTFGSFIADGVETEGDKYVYFRELNLFLSRHREFMLVMQGPLILKQVW